MHSVRLLCIHFSVDVHYTVSFVCDTVTVDGGGGGGGDGFQGFHPVFACLPLLHTLPFSTYSAVGAMVDGGWWLGWVWVGGSIWYSSLE